MKLDIADMLRSVGKSQYRVTHIWSSRTTRTSGKEKFARSTIYEWKKCAGW
jgi:hypothetical protein